MIKGLRYLKWWKNKLLENWSYKISVLGVPNGTPRQEMVNFIFDMPNTYYNIMR